MHEHKFVIGEFGAFCMEAECMYAFSAHDIAKILADIANSVSAQQSVQSDTLEACAKCGRFHSEFSRC